MICGILFPMEEQAYKDRIQALEDELALALSRVEHWKNLYLAANQKRFGRSTENAQQLDLGLFDEAEALSLADAAENTEGQLTGQKVRTYVRRVSRSRMLTLDPSTPVTDIVHEGFAPVCGCGATMVPCGEFVRDTLAVVPSSKVIVRHHYPQYRCPSCLPDSGEGGKVVPSEDPSVLAGTVCDPSLLSTIVTDKMEYGLPLYRQERKSLEDGTGISRQAMSTWMMAAGDALGPLAQALERSLHSYPMWNMDETGLRVLQTPGQKESGSARNCFMVVRATTALDGSHGPVVFSFSERRTDDVIAGFLDGYRGVVQTDDLSGYRNAAKARGGDDTFVHLMCMVHARRKAADILKTNRQAKLAGELVALYGAFFHHEGELCDQQKGPHALSGERYLARRREILGADLDALKEWLERHEAAALKGSALATAIGYPLRSWDALTRFLDYGFATSSNQIAENAIRPFAVARKNFLFCVTPEGARTSALYYSLVESCRAMGVNAHAYLTYLFSHAAGCRSDDDWDSLVPGKADLREVDDYYRKLRSAVPDPQRREPYVLRGKKY